MKTFDTTYIANEDGSATWFSPEASQDAAAAHVNDAAKVETRLKMSEAHKGKHQTQEHCQKISEAMKGENNPLFGKHHSAETRLKMSEALSGENHPLFGKHHSEETRQKMSASHKGKKLGVHWWNNGISSKHSRECPGEGWRRGKLMLSIS